MDLVVVQLGIQANLLSSLVNFKIFVRFDVLQTAMDDRLYCLVILLFLEM